MKRIAAMVLALALVATMAITSSVAYLTDEEEAVNVFSVGKVDIIQKEEERNGTELKDFTQEDMKHPMVESREENVKQTAEWEFDETTVNLRNPDFYANYVDKIVTVENAGESAAYIRNIVAIPTGGADVPWLEVDWFDFDTKANADWEEASVVKDVEIDGVLYDIYVINYVADEGVFAKGDSTLPTLLGFGLSKYVDYDDTEGAETYYYMKDGVRTDIEINPAEMKIYVATQAVQSAGFADFEHAFDETFGEISKTNHPWKSLSMGYAYVGKTMYTWDELVEKELVTVRTFGNSTEKVLTKVDPSITELVLSGNTVERIASNVTGVESSSQSADCNLETLIIGDGVKTIGSSAFRFLDSLKSVTFPSTPITIKGNTFEYCDSLTEIYLPGTVVFVDDCHFKDCNALEKVTMGEGIESIPRMCFDSCDNLSSVVIPKSVKSIGDSAFSWCSSLTDAGIKGKTTDFEYVGTNAFKHTSVSIPSTTT